MGVRDELCRQCDIRRVRSAAATWRGNTPADPSLQSAQHRDDQPAWWCRNCGEGCSTPETAPSRISFRNSQGEDRGEVAFRRERAV